MMGGVLEGQYTYLILNIFTLSLPLLLSFDKKVAFYKSWKHLFPSIIIVGALFIIWDVWFTKTGVWSFNDAHLIGVRILNLPLEEWLFFITIPYACVFIYECLRCWIDVKMSKLTVQYITIFLSTILLIIGLFNFNKVYTSITFISLAVCLWVHLALFQEKILKNFLPAYAIAIVPFLLVNGVLTANPVVVYNNSENLAFRITTIPVEDIFYGMLLVLLNVSFMEFFKKQKPKSLVKRQKLQTA